ncbi:MAG TPA: PDZ domain-containing protein [Bryobacteraceae bacterium]|nr:PDZ domain-containing protein [Bryobacteraceae bacterium]
MSCLRLGGILCFSLFQIAAAGLNDPACSVWVNGGSDNDGNFCTDSSCGTTCGLSPLSLQRVLNPDTLGIFERTEGSASVVDLVVPNSPAALGGILEGDHILSVDGLPAPLTGSNRQIWNQGRDHVLRVLRNGRILTLAIRTEGLRDVLLQALYGDKMATGVTIPMKPFVSGLNTSRTNNGLLVTGLLPFSPADRAGLKAGDLVVTVTPASSEPIPDATASIEAADYRSEISLQVLRSGQRLSFRLEMASVTELLRAAAESGASRSMSSYTPTSF